MKSDACFLKPPSQRSRVTLRVRGLGPVPAFKNSKVIAGKKLLTKREYRLWMKRCVESFVSQCISGTAMQDDVMPTEPCPRFSIALLPRDDNWKEIPELAVWARMVPKGFEGAIITIEEL